jgi:uncharacterized protein (DUF1778 family)
MARPPKNKSLLMDVPLRIMLTADQKRLVDDAAKRIQSDVAAWLRPILLRAAEDVLARTGSAHPRDATKNGERGFRSRQARSA